VKYSTRHVCTLFQVSSETVRTWAEEFQEHLSVNANPGTGRHRQFTEDDMRVLSLVSQMKRDNMTFVDIHVSLKGGQRGNPPVLPASEVQALVVGEREAQLASQIQRLQQIVAQIEQERDALLPIREENIRLKARLEATEESTHKRIQELAAQLEKAQVEIKQLHREMGKLEAQADRGRQG
jgi:DNA-binding transcriptional MerR regulator